MIHISARHIALCGIAFLSAAAIAGCMADEGPKYQVNTKRMTFNEQKEEAIRRASDEYRAWKSEGGDMGSGPCLAEEIITGWSVDIVHLPRLELDDLPQNQCQKYRRGKTEYLIELSTEGDLVSVSSKQK